ncbi:MAG: transposase [Gammaproteobacteria bacterium]|nr:transposase [Gammaproteobacteria bacterium]NIR98439.1 transposase [Gammaproteobacteria bacterium]NIT64186.1 transposase [Gammaproteobacteria bacterium]NIV21126.1 transposase [Gammaproteobacteria bacterium]NIX10603.1 transposase [Gammaproteobacteria bacterium]
MPNYRRNRVDGGCYFFTVVAHQRRPWLCTRSARQALRAAVNRVRDDYPFRIEAWVLLTDHMHCIWSLPKGDHRFPLRWQLIKTYVTRSIAPARRLWQRRYWEHTIRDQIDFNAHCDYIHYNPVKHGLCAAPGDWRFSSFHRFVQEGRYPPDWAALEGPGLGEDIGSE